MATADDLLRLHPHLPVLARAAHQAVRGRFGENGGWLAVVLDVRWCTDPDSGNIRKVRVEMPDGRLESVDLAPEAAQVVWELGSLRPSGADRWYGLRLRVTATGECETTFNYDPHCIDDDSFYDS